ncbi:MAG: hypothetical protein JNM58_18680 [Xanthomonadaceae bacterium]|nr:hypothetical protein [Xanthomonadaceae bacterium]
MGDDSVGVLSSIDRIADLASPVDEKSRRELILLGKFKAERVVASHDDLGSLFRSCKSIGTKTFPHDRQEAAMHRHEANAHAIDEMRGLLKKAIPLSRR